MIPICKKSYKKVIIKNKMLRYKKYNKCLKIAINKYLFKAINSSKKI